MQYLLDICFFVVCRQIWRVNLAFSVASSTDFCVKAAHLYTPYSDWQAERPHECCRTERTIQDVVPPSPGDTIADIFLFQDNSLTR